MLSRNAIWAKRISKGLGRLLGNYSSGQLTVMEVSLQR